jgi:hypothetical protein
MGYIQIVLMRNGNLIPVYGTDRARVDYSVLRFVEVGGRLILTHNRYSIPTCMVFVSGSSFWGVAFLRLWTYASGWKYFVVGTDGKVHFFLLFGTKHFFHEWPTLLYRAKRQGDQDRSIGVFVS